VLYRIAQEGLTNAARHSGATTVELSLTPADGGVLLSITDDGTGLDGSAEGAGIRGMRERALLVGGELTVGAGPEGGTRVSLYVPIAEGGPP
jgi:two-component system sensor histidine kinase UhpB